MISGHRRAASLICHAVVWILTVSLVLYGCATKTLPPYPTQAASSYPYVQVKDGLTIGIKPLIDSHESERYFDTDLLSRGVLAIYVSAENREASRNFLLLRNQFTLQTALKEEARVSGHEQINSPGLNTVKTIMTTAAALTASLSFGLPFWPVATGIDAHEERVKTKFVAEELRAKTISWGEETHGFVYFRRPPDFPGPSQVILHLEAQDTNTKEIKVFDFVLNKNLR